MIYTVPSDTSSLYLPTIKQSQVVTNGPHAHGITAPRDPALSCRPLKLIHPSLAAQVGVDKSSERMSQLQGHHSMEREDCLEFLNFIFYWKSWQCWATDLRRSTASNLSAQPTFLDKGKPLLKLYRAWCSALMEGAWTQGWQGPDSLHSLPKLPCSPLAFLSLRIQLSIA